MKISIVNYKGGTGKSMVAYQLISGFNYYGLDLDPAGSLAERLSDRVKRIMKNEKLPALDTFDEDIILDFAGVFHEDQNKQIAEAAKYTDLFIVPYIPTLENVQSTVDTLNAIKEFNIPILIVVNQYQKESDVSDSIFVFEDVLQMEIDSFRIPLSLALQTSINQNKSIVELSEQKGIASYAYKKTAKIFADLHEKIQSYK